MSLNSFVTKDSGEMGRAQVVQAQACRIEPDVDMNPILIKPTADTKAQIILKGKPIGNMSAQEYVNYKSKAWECATAAFRRLQKKYEVIVIEGAGSPAEINLKKHDIVNMKIAEIADAPVILAGDIDRGGVFAWLIGTLGLLSRNEQRRIKGFIINKFRGDKTLLRGGIRFLEKKTNKPVLGVIPYFNQIRIPEEDSVNLEMRRDSALPNNSQKDTINIAVVKLPYTSNFTDFDALENEPGVRLRYVDNKLKLSAADAIIIPGTKNTIKDLIWLKETGLADKIVSLLKQGPLPVLAGICGGYQMLGKVIYDRQAVESAYKEFKGLGLLPIATSFGAEKKLSQVEAQELYSNTAVSGYEIHYGKTTHLGRYWPLFKISGSKHPEGAKTKDGRIWGTYIHGVFDSDAFRQDFLDRICIKKGLSAVYCIKNRFSLDGEIDKLADLVEASINLELLYKILKHEL